MLVLALLVCYLVGSIPTAFLLVRRTARLDIRTVGSGNVGATNAARVAGTWVGLGVFLFDTLKGFLAAAAIASWLLEDPDRTVRLGCGAAAVLGHNVPVFLRFHGGKGVATTIGVLLGTMPGVAAWGLSLWITVFLVFRYVSIASMALGMAIPVLQVLARHPFADVLLGALLGLGMVVRHSGNLTRLSQGTEPRVSFRRR